MDFRYFRKPSIPGVVSFFLSLAKRQQKLDDGGLKSPASVLVDLVVFRYNIAPINDCTVKEFQKTTTLEDSQKRCHSFSCSFPQNEHFDLTCA